MPVAVGFIMVGLSLGQASAATLDASDCSNTAIQSAINIASAGDTVRVPGGSCTWSGGIGTQKKPLKVVGAGIDVTRINLGPNVDPVTVDGCSERVPCEVSGFTFDGLNNTRTSRGIIVVGGSGLEKSFRVHHVKITSVCQPNGAGSGGIAILGAYGLVDHVDISKGAINCSAQGISIDGAGHREWNLSVPWGTDNLVVVEASRFDFCTPDAGARAAGGAVAISTGGKAAIRYNDFRCASVENHGLDSAAVGAVFMDVFSNTFTYDAPDHWVEAIGILGGTGALHDNFVGQNGTAQNNNYDSFAQLRMYRPWAAYVRNIWGGRGMADGNPETYCDRSGASKYINACENDSDCAPNFGRCGAHLCRRISDNVSPFVDANDAPLVCSSDSECMSWESSGLLPSGIYVCDGTADGDRIPHPSGVSTGIASGGNSISLSVSGAPWVADEWKWFFAYNDSDGSRCLATGNSENTINCNGLEYVRDGQTQPISGTLRGSISGATGTVLFFEDANSAQQFGRLALSNVSGTFLLYENLQINCPAACQTVGHAVTGHGLFGGTRNTWQPTDRFHLSIGWPARQAPGVGQYGTQLDPIYAWNNSFKGQVGGYLRVSYSDYGNSKLLVENRDFFNVQKPGHTDIVCPDPRAKVQGQCDLSLPGRAGYPPDPVEGAQPQPRQFRATCGCRVIEPELALVVMVLTAYRRRRSMSTARSKSAL